MIAYSNGVIGTEYHSTSQSAINAAKAITDKVNQFPSDIIGLRIDFTDGTCAVFNAVQKSECLQ